MYKSPIAGVGRGVAAWLQSPNSVNLALAVTDETGSGALVFANTPTLVTPVLGAATATTINGVTIDNNAWTPTTPTVTAQTGSFTTVSCAMYHKQIGKIVSWYAKITVTDIGTASVRMIVPLPVNTARTGTAVVSGFNSTTLLGMTGMNGYDTAHSVTVVTAGAATFPVTGSGQDVYISSDPYEAA